MAYQNINQYNFRKLLLSPVREISDISLASDERNFNEEVIFSPLLIGEEDGNKMPIKIDFNTPTIIQRKPFDSDTIVSENYWNPTNTDPNLCATAYTLCDVGLTGIDNGLVRHMSGETIEITTGLYLNDSDKFSRYKYDRRFKMHPITGFTTTENRLWNDNSYTYNLTYGAEPYIGYYTKLQGGFYQGFYKLAGYEYEVLPERQNLGWTAEFVLRYRWTGDTEVGLNKRYPQNKGTFFYLGARAENKFYHYPGNTQVTLGLDRMYTHECQAIDRKCLITPGCYNAYQQPEVEVADCICPGTCECSKVVSFPELNPLFDGVSNGLSIRFSGDTGNPKICVKTYRITGECVSASACTTELTYVTGTSITEWCSEKGIFDDCADTDYINEERWVQIDAVFRRNTYLDECDLLDKGGLGDVVTEEYIDTIYDRSLCLVTPPETQDQTPPETTEVVNITDKWLEDKKYRLGTFRIYVNGKVFMEIEDFEEIIPRPLNAVKEKQLGVPFNISLGGGTQGLKDNLTYSGGCPPTPADIVYGQDPECLTTYDLSNTIYAGLKTEIRLEEIFGGSFIGDISFFNMYIEPLDASEVRHNFNLLKDRFQLLDFYCIDCNPTPITPPTECDIEINILPNITPSSTPIPSTTPTITPTPTETPCLVKSCNDCPDPPGGWVEYNQDSCYRVQTIGATSPTNPLSLTARTLDVYSSFGTQFMSSNFNFDGTGDVEVELGTPIVGGSYINPIWSNPNQNNIDGPLNRCGLWNNPYSDRPYNTWVGFSDCLTGLTSNKTYYIGVGADNEYKVVLDGIEILNTSGNVWIDYQFKWWHVYPINVGSGDHVLEIFGLNIFSEAVFGCEIYDNTLSELTGATSYSELNVVYTSSGKTTATVVQNELGEYISSGYTCPSGFVYSTCEGSCIKYDFCELCSNSTPTPTKTPLLTTTPTPTPTKIPLLTPTPTTTPTTTPTSFGEINTIFMGFNTL